MERTNHKIVFDLVQHTPIIHFQPGQSGATLRATELKPKFDRFLLSVNPELPARKNAGGEPSLEYKIKITPNVHPAESIEQRHPLFFANMGDGQEKKFKKYTQPFQIEFFSFKPAVLDAVEKHFEAFLAHTNFGTRQSKGFGSFYLKGKKFNASLIKPKVYSFDTHEEWEKDIGLFYQFLRQGINLPRRNKPFYTKPIIFTYAKSKGWQWEKKSIKERFFKHQLQGQQQKHKSDVLTYSSDKKYIVRDLFGLSSSQQWMSYKVTIEKKHIDKEIERFKSPVTFKVVDNKVFFWANKSVNDILNQKFEISAGRDKKMTLPTPPEFEFDDFFSFVLHTDLSKHIEEDFHNTYEYHQLVRIFKSLKEER